MSIAQGFSPKPTQLIAWADTALTQAQALQAWQPGEHDLLVQVAQLLRRAVEAPPGGPGEVETIALLCGHLHASASHLHEHQIQPWDTEPYSAAWELGRAALQLLVAIDEGGLGPV